MVQVHNPDVGGDTGNTGTITKLFMQGKSTSEILQRFRVIREGLVHNPDPVGDTGNTGTIAKLFMQSKRMTVIL